MKHLSTREFVDLIDGTLSTERTAHLDGCAGCREQVAALHRTFDAARAIEIPEPSPMFWDHFSTRVRAEVDQIGRPAPAMIPVWLRYAAPSFIGAAVVIFVMFMALRNDTQQTVARDKASEPVDAIAWQQEPFADDPAWDFVMSFATRGDWAGSSVATSVNRPVAMDRAVGALSDTERLEFARLLEQELEKAKSEP